MKRYSLPLLFALAASTLLWVQNKGNAPGPLEAAEQQSPMLMAAKALQATFTAEQRDSGMFAFDDEERQFWHFTPYPHAGIDWRTFSEGQRDQVINLLQTTLSDQGYGRTREIMEMENMLRILENRSDTDERRNPERYYFSLFGQPSDTQPWGWRFEGHHISLNFSSVAGGLSVTPAFFGSNPARVPVGPTKGYRILDAEEDIARELMALFSDAQRKTAIIMPEAPVEMITANAPRISLDTFEGLPYGSLNDEQQEKLNGLIRLYLNNMKPRIAEKKWQDIKEADLDKLHFAWAGTLTPGEAHYYRIHGPNLLIEYDNTQNNANHVHTVLRDPNSDWGDDLLKQHYKAAEHKH